MQNGDYLSKVHREILTVADEVIRICELHHLTYYMVGGTLLGAVRHGGFIPWDDDFDIAMPRKDFRSFLKLAKTELRAPFALSWISEYPNYWHMFAKVENTGTAFYQGVQYQQDKYPGIFVDIFPLDTAVSYRKTVELRKKLLRTVIDMKGMKLSVIPVKPSRRFILHCFSSRALHRIGELLMTLANWLPGDWYVNYSSQYSAKRQTIQKKLYGEGRLIPFEDRMLCAPDDANAVLTSIFGPDYMQLPPPEKRRSHYPKYVKFSDGTEMHFGEPENKVKVDYELPSDSAARK